MGYATTNRILTNWMLVMRFITNVELQAKPWLLVGLSQQIRGSRRHKISRDCCWLQVGHIDSPVDHEILLRWGVNAKRTQGFHVRLRLIYSHRILDRQIRLN